MNMILHYYIVICKTVLLPVYKIEIFHLRFLHEIFPLQTETVSREGDHGYEEDHDLLGQLETGQFGHQCENVPAIGWFTTTGLALIIWSGYLAVLTEL